MNDNRRGGSNIFWNLTVIHPCFQDILKTLFAPTGEPRFLAGNYGIDDDVIPLRSCISSCCSSCCCTLCLFFVEVCEDIFIMSKPTSGGMLKTWGKELALLGYSVGIAFSFLVFGYLQEKLAKGYELPGRSERLKFPSEIVLLLLATVLNCVFSRILLSFVAPSKPPRAGAAPEGFMSRNLPFIKLSVSYIVAMVCSSMAIRYISYPAQ